MTEEDIPAVCALEEICFPGDPWPKEEFLFELRQNPFSQVYVYEKDGRIAGYIDWWIMYEQAQLADIAVHPDYRRCGIGKEMMDFCIAESNAKGCETLSLEVRKSNFPALAMYRSYGFIEAAIRKNYYEDGEDAILMVLPLGGGYDADTGN